MRDLFIGAVTITTGIILAAVILAAGWDVMRPAQTVTIELSTHDCATNGRKIECTRK